MGVEEPIIGESQDPPSGTRDIGVLVHEHYQSLYAYAYRLTGKTNDAEDLTQQTFLIAQQKIDQLRDGGKARHWLFRVMRNRFIRTLEKKRPLTESDSELEIGEIPESETFEKIDSELLQLAVNDLPDDYKLVVLMYYFDELSYKEIAAEIDAPIGTVMSRLARAKTALRNKMSQASVQG